MKIFAIYARVELIKKPDWLDDFRLRYDEPVEYHVTLKQHVLIEKEKVQEVKAKLAKLFDGLKITNHEILLTFDSLNIDTTEISDDNACVMIDASNVEEIFKLQRSILFALQEYNQYYKIKAKVYEENFKPHITIARDLDEKSYLLAKKELGQDYVCQGVIKEIVLAVVDNPTPEEGGNPNNQTIYRL